jgi:hypothetical protein
MEILRLHIEARDARGMTPLFRAVSIQNEETTEFLIEFGAKSDVNALGVSLVEKSTALSENFAQKVKDAIERKKTGQPKISQEKNLEKPVPLFDLLKKSPEMNVSNVPTPAPVKANYNPFFPAWKQSDSVAVAKMPSNIGANRVPIVTATGIDDIPAPITANPPSPVPSTLPEKSEKLPDLVPEPETKPSPEVVADISHLENVVKMRLFMRNLLKKIESLSSFGDGYPFILFFKDIGPVRFL